MSKIWQKNFLNRLLRIFHFILLLFNGLLGFIILKEFFVVGTLKDIEGYPSGSECVDAFNYKSPEICARAALIDGIIFSILFLLHSGLS